MSDDLVNITLDGHQLSVPKGTLLVEAAREVGIEIPVYCYHPKMKPVGACRVCVVEVENQRRPIMTACTTTVMPDMVVHTQSENAIAAREGVLEFLLINHPLDCPVCDRAGECDLQDFTLRYGPGTTRFVEEKRHFEKSKQVGQNVVLDRERCIMCQRCVRFCDEIAMEEGLVIIERGNRSEIGTFEGRSFDSRFSGNVIELCPVGALTAKTYRFESRPWEQQHYAGICNVSSLGVNITVDVRYDKVVRMRSRLNEDIDDGWLTDDCRYSHLPVHSEDRILTPQLRNGKGELEEVSWEKALERVAAEVKADGKSVGILASPKLSVEDGHSLVHLGRSVLETPHVNHEFSQEALQTGETVTGLVRGCDQADVILCVGSDPSQTHPDFELRVKKGLRAKAKLVCLTEEEAMVGFTDFQATGEPEELWTKLFKAIKKKSKDKEPGIQHPKPRPWEAGGETSTVWKHLVECVKSAERVLVVCAGDLIDQGLENLPKEVEALGWAEAPHGLIHLRTGANSFGLDLVGLGKNFEDDEVNEPYRNSWGTFNSKESLTSAELAQGKTDVLMAIGSNPLLADNAKKAKFLVAAATHPNETTAKADLVLPLSTWLESNGVFVSTDGTVQFNRQAILPQGESKPAHQIAQALIDVLEEEAETHKTSRTIYREIGQVNAYFSGCSYRDFQKQGEVHWSYPQQADLGMPRPDLSAIPVKQPDAPMWMPAVSTGSEVELSARLHRGQQPPPVPGQKDPRQIAAMLGLGPSLPTDPVNALTDGSVDKKEGYIPLRVVASNSAEPAGPTPSSRHHQIGVGRHKGVSVPIASTALLEAPAEEELEAEVIDDEAELEAEQSNSDESEESSENDQASTEDSEPAEESDEEASEEEGGEEE